MKLKIISTGKPDGTRIVNAENDVELEGVIYARINLDAINRGVPKVTIGLTDVALELVIDNVDQELAGMTGYLGE